MAGIEDVFLDVSGDMFGDLAATMSKAMAAAHFCISIGTPRLKARAQEVGATPNNLQYELGLVWDRCQRDPNFLIPVVFDGATGNAFPEAILSSWFQAPANEGKSADAAQLTSEQRVAALELPLFGQKTGPLLARLAALEEAILGEVTKGALLTRIAALEASS